MLISDTLLKAIEEFSKFPGIGKKTAQRLALYLLKIDQDSYDTFIQAIINLKSKLHNCKTCFNFTENEYCDICVNDKRDKSVICVVEEASDILAIEKTNEYRGTYHVLGGALSPITGITHDKLRIKELIERIASNHISEIILALNPDTEGDTTALYITRLLEKTEIKTTRLARGLPVGGDLEFADEATIIKAINNRISI